MFGPAAYSELLDQFIDEGFVFRRFSDAPRPRSVILRHDVDFSLEDSAAVARIEHQKGIAATYFFMASSHSYNLLARDSQETVRAIRAMGHGISLHFDPTAYADMDEGFAAERELFERLFGEPIEIVSIHRPGAFLDNRNRPMAGCRHTYEDAYFRDMAYRSDSAGRDIRPALQEWRSDPGDAPLQLLLHPVWWARESGSPTETLEDWLSRRADFLADECGRNCRSFRT